MAKQATVTSDEGIHPKQPCPCGSGKRYKVCHGAPGGAEDVIVTRPFEGLAAECELVALREFVPSATAELPLGADRTVTLATVLPMASAALVREPSSEEEGAAVEAMVGMQVQTRSGDISHDLGRAVEWALAAEPGDSLAVVNTKSGSTTRLQDHLPADAEIHPTVHKDFGWWIPEGTTPSREVSLSLERANQVLMPTERLDAPGLRAAYWTDAKEKAHLRWVRPEPEERLLAAMARLSARGELDLGEDSRYAGSFRAHGLLVPVWDLDPEPHAREWTEPAAALGTRLEQALESLDIEPLSESERRSLHGLRGRQFTLR